MGGTNKKPRIKKNGPSAVVGDAGGSATKRKRGRPTTYTDEIGTAICEAVADGKHIMPTLHSLGVKWGVMCGWLDIHPHFAAMYARAGERRADRDFEGMDQLAADMLAGHVDPQVGREVASIKKWALSKRLPKKYGDKVAMDHTVTPVEAVRVIVTSGSDPYYDAPGRAKQTPSLPPSKEKNEAHRK